MRSTFVRFTMVLAIMALPALLEPPWLRLGMLAACLGVSLALGARWYLKQGGAVQPDGHAAIAGPGSSPQAGRDDGGDRVRLLSHQLQEVVEQTEHAALEINERVLNIIGRARAQQRTIADMVSGLSREGAERGDGGPVSLTPMIEALAAETASLSKDVNGVIMSLQFQDVTRQQLEKVIDGLQDLRCEMAAAPPRATAAVQKRSSRPAGPPLPEGGAEEPFQQGRRDG